MAPRLAVFDGPWKLYGTEWMRPCLTFVDGVWRRRMVEGPEVQALAYVMGGEPVRVDPNGRKWYRAAAVDGGSDAS